MNSDWLISFLLSNSFLLCHDTITTISKQIKRPFTALYQMTNNDDVNSSAREGYKCPCCNNPWSAATGEFFAKLCGECQETTPAKGIDRSNMDFDTLPSDNFYKYSNGKWLEKNPIPSGYPSKFVQYCKIGYFSKVLAVAAIASCCSVYASAARTFLLACLF